VQKYDEEEQLLQEKIAALKEEYKNSVSSLESSENSMLQMSGKLAQESIANAANAGNNIQKILLGINESFSSQVESLFSKTEEYMSKQVSKIAQVFESLGSSFTSISNGGSPSSDTNVNVTLNDYGDKNLADNNSIGSYANEFISILQNVLRSQGIK